MDHPDHPWPALLVMGLVPALVVVAEEDRTAPRPRTVSPRVAGMLAAAMPKYEPVRSAASATPGDSTTRAWIAEGVEMGPSNTIVRLPNYVVREPRLPAREDLMTRSEREKFAMQKYLGDEDGLYRVMNMFSIAGAWEKIPVLGKYPFIVGQSSSRHAGPAVGPRTNEQRALALYEKEKEAQRWEALSGLLSPSLKPDAVPATK